MSTMFGRSQRRGSLVRRWVPEVVELEARQLLTTYMGNQIFPLDNPWNQKISGAPVASNSDAMINNIGTTRRLHLDLGDIYGIPINVVTNANPGTTTNVVIDAYPTESDIGPIPIPANPRIEGGSDRHMLVYNRDTNQLWETFATSTPGENPADGQYHADQESYWDLNQNWFRPLTWTSADAAGLPILPGLLRPDEVDQAVATGVPIDHAFRFTVVQSRRDFVFPASHFAAPRDRTGEQYARMGERFRLKADFVIPSTWSAQSRVVAQAFKDYGLIVADNGSNWFITGEMNDAWAAPRFSRFYSELQSIAGSWFEAVDLTPVVHGLSVLAGHVDGGTRVVINGLNFSGSAGKLHVFFGGVAATNFTIDSDSQITVYAPPHAAGRVDVVVKQGDLNAAGNVVWGYGASAVTAASQFTYRPDLPVEPPPPPGGGGGAVPRDLPGVYRSGVWSLDLNGNRGFDGGDAVLQFGSAGDKHLVGDWDGDGWDNIGIFRNVPNGVGLFSLDTNGNLVFDGGDDVFLFGLASDTVLIGDWDGGGRDKVGVFRDNGQGVGLFSLDTNGNRGFDGGDDVFLFGLARDVMVVGDWDGDRRDEVGVYRDNGSGVGVWSLDTNGSRWYDAGDEVFLFGLASDWPIVGKWRM
jgi:hypothetical protein